MDFEQRLSNQNDSVPDEDIDEVHVVYIKPPIEKIHELVEFVKTLFSGVKNCEQTNGYIKIVFVDKMSKTLTVDRHQKTPFRWPGHMENLIFLESITGMEKEVGLFAGENKKRKLESLNKNDFANEELVLYLEHPQGGLNI